MTFTIRKRHGYLETYVIFFTFSIERGFMLLQKPFKKKASRTANLICTYKDVGFA